MSKLMGCACEFRELERIPRSFWMRWIPFVRFYYCRQCRQQFLASKRKVDAARRMSVVYMSNSAGHSMTSAASMEPVERNDVSA
ncbi:hypothetical protein [Variovorax ginsengisoli]|uniref:DUF2256 domain-containing protein n=1 Tax=Variovorax ginsengisoli TaxID=363844 RepID=A0ABT9S3W1_9BURK|nr:hypothetical protein [Variovorax ginsengisoli]MDP9899036.1 hypothetical protein [Variovorax ginsengisoli]